MAKNLSIYKRINFKLDAGAHRPKFWAAFFNVELPNLSRSSKTPPTPPSSAILLRKFNIHFPVPSSSPFTGIIEETRRLLSFFDGIVFFFKILKIDFFFFSPGHFLCVVSP